MRMVVVADVVVDVWVAHRPIDVVITKMSVRVCPELCSPKIIRKLQPYTSNTCPELHVDGTLDDFHWSLGIGAIAWSNSVMITSVVHLQKAGIVVMHAGTRRAWRLSASNRPHIAQAHTEWLALIDDMAC